MRLDLTAVAALAFAVSGCVTTSMQGYADKVPPSQPIGHVAALVTAPLPLAQSMQASLVEAKIEVVQVREQFLAAQERLKVASESVQQADEALRMVRDRYNGGLTTITEVLRSQTAQLQAKTSLLGARYDYFVGYANVLLATGGLNDVRAFTDRESASAPLIERGDR